MTAMTTIREVRRRAWERGATAGNYAVEYESLERDEDGNILAPDDVLSGRWAGESITELIPELRDASDDEFEALADAYESAYGEGYLAFAEWAGSDDDVTAPVNPYDEVTR